jgi:transposase
MSNNNKKQYSDSFKLKVALAALKGDKTHSTLCKEFGLHETQITRWKTILRDNGADLFSIGIKKNSNETSLKQQIKELNEYIGELSIENKFLKKNLDL